jgi:hypothetical protein
MKQWWKRNRNVVLGDYTEAEVEDFTGCIPLLLDVCVVNGKIDLRVQAMKSVWNEVASFVSNIKENTTEVAWERYSPFFNFKTLLTSRRYCKYVDACLRRCPVPAGVRPGLIDHRYFYAEKSKGDYTCGIAREAVIGQLRHYGWNRFGNTALLSLND